MRFWRDRLRPFLAEIEWLVVGVLAVAAFALGYLGFRDQPTLSGEGSSTLDVLYHSLQLFVLEYSSSFEPASWELDVARILAPAVTFYAAARALAALFRDQLDVLRARFRPAGVVVCGLGRGGSLVAKGFKERKDKVVAIELDERSGAIREARQKGVIVLRGNATDMRLLRKAGLDRAAHLVVFCGDDGINAEVAIAARDVVRGRAGKPLRCHVQVLDVELRNLLEESQLTASEEAGFSPEFFNAAERGAPALLDAHPPFDDGGKTASEGAPHLLVVGLGEMGANVVVHAALRWRVNPEPSQLPVTVVDLQATSRLGLLSRRYRRLQEVCDLKAIDLDVHDPEFQGGDFLREGEKRAFLRRDEARPPVTIVYVCLDEDGRGLGAALALRRLPELRGVPIVVRMTQHAELAGLVEEERAASTNLHTFGLLDWTCTPEVLMNGAQEIMARAIHEAYVRGQLADGYTWGQKPAIKEWEDLDELYRESSRSQADHIGVKLAAIGCDLARLTDWDEQPMTFTPDEVERMAILEHDRWNAERLSTGWRWGPEKDEQGKVSPYLVAWPELAENVKEWDRRTVRELPVFLARVGYRVVR